MISAIDRRLLRFARTHWHTPARDRLVSRFSRVGEHGGVWLAIGATGTAVSDDDRWRAATLRVAFAYGTNTVLKLIVRRRRPEGQLIATPTGLAFPSAHAATSFAGARAYSRLGLPRAPLYTLACALAASRVYLGAHYPSDVLAGALLGTVIG